MEDGVSPSLEVTRLSLDGERALGLGACGETSKSVIKRIQKMMKIAGSSTGGSEVGAPSLSAFAFSSRSAANRASSLQLTLVKKTEEDEVKEKSNFFCSASLRSRSACFRFSSYFNPSAKPQKKETTRTTSIDFMTRTSFKTCFSNKNSLCFYRF